nr:hypothetical protein [Actinomadura sp. HBU206391]
MAADTVHDCLIDASRRAPRMRDRMRLRAWLYGAARRRCLQRGRSGGLHWEWAAAQAPHAAREEAHEDDGAEDRLPRGEFGSDEYDVSGLSLDERRELLELTLARLDFSEQEALLLALRHEVTGSDLAATLGVSGRRAASRLARARAQADAALNSELRVLSWRCADTEQTGARPAGPTRQTEHTATGSVDSDALGSAAVDSAAVEAVEDRETPEAADRPEPVRSRESLKTVIEAAGKAGTAAASARGMDEARSSGHTAQRDHRADPDGSDGAGDPAAEWRDRITLNRLLDLAQAPAPPAALRRRVFHTATDPELAGYRADIAGRGGNLTTQGLPRQPDVAPPFARRWMFAAGGLVGALVTAAVAIVIIGPDLPGPQIYWPSGPRHKTPSPPLPSQSMPGREQAAPPGDAGPGSGRRVAAPQLDGRLRTPSPGPRTPRLPPQPGRLILGATEIGLGARERETHLNLSASQGAVTWSAATSSPQLTLSAEGGKIPKGGTTRIDIMFQRGLIQLEGHATITLTSVGGRPQTVTVTWAGSLLT